MPQFHETGYGRTFYEGQVPRLTETLMRIAVALEEANRLKTLEIDDFIQGIRQLEESGKLEAFKEFLKKSGADVTRVPFHWTLRKEDRPNEE